MKFKPFLFAAFFPFLIYAAAAQVVLRPFEQRWTY